MHRRKSSKEDPLEEMSTVAPPKQGLTNGTGEHTLGPSPSINGINGVNGAATRPRTLSTPSTPSYQEYSRPQAIPSPSSLRPSFSSSGSPPSPVRTSFGHSRTRSTSRPMHSPLATSFQPGSPDSDTFQFPTSNDDASSNGPTSPVIAQNPRRHARIHSRNLSIFFPRPGSLPQATIMEDGAQEMELDQKEKLKGKKKQEGTRNVLVLVFLKAKRLKKQSKMCRQSLSSSLKVIFGTDGGSRSTTAAQSLRMTVALSVTNSNARPRRAQTLSMFSSCSASSK